MCTDFSFLPLLIIFSVFYTCANTWSHVSSTVPSHPLLPHLLILLLLTESPTLLSCVCQCGCTPLLLVHNCNDHVKHRRQCSTEPLSWPFSGCSSAHSSVMFLRTWKKQLQLGHSELRTQQLLIFNTLASHWNNCGFVFLRISLMNKIFTPF